MKKYIALFLLLLYVFCLTACTSAPASKEADADVNWVYPPMVMIDGELYLNAFQERVVVGTRTEFDGEITSEVPADEKPSKDDQSNFGMGYGYVFGEIEGTIELNIEGKWYLFATKEVREQIRDLE